MIYSDAIEVKRLTSEEWAPMAEKAHIVVFDELRPSFMNRIDWVLMGVLHGTPMGYVTVRELDSETLYWSYGGAFPETFGTIKVLPCYKLFAEQSKKYGFKRIFTSIKNTNRPMLKMALNQDFVVVGMRTFENEIFLELLKELKEN